MTTEYGEDSERVDEHYDVTEGGYELHITGALDDVEVWLSLARDGDGLAIGGGESRRAAVADAIETLERALGILREQL